MEPVNQWEHVNYLLEQLKQEGDFEFLQAFEFLLEQAIAWRFTGVAWRNLAEAFEKDNPLRESAKERDDCYQLLRTLRTKTDEQYFFIRDLRRIVERFM
jgi:hypothetical protein